MCAQARISMPVCICVYPYTYKFLHKQARICMSTEPVFTPDGKKIYFVSDRSGSPQIYRISLSGGTAQRITFNGINNTSPALSPDGNLMAFISKFDGKCQLMLLDFTSGKITSLTDSKFDSKPSFAPNGKLILYTTRVQGKDSMAINREILMTTTLDGVTRFQIARNSPTSNEPHWGPFLMP